MPMSDDRSPKYRHCCCNIRVATYVIGILELISVLYILTQHSIRSIIADVQQPDNGKQPNTATASSDNTSARRWLGPGATTPLVTWAVCETLFLGLMFYGIARTRPWLLIPQLFLQIVTIIVCMILNILMVCVLAWHPGITEIWYFLTSTVIFAFLYEYGLVVMIRCYRYLRDRVAMETHTAHGIFVLPTGANGEILMTATNEAMMESRMYSDLPPEYAAVIGTMPEDGQKPATAPAPASAPSTVHTVSETIDVKPEAETKADSDRDLEHGNEEEAKGECHVDENAPPPTYEEARQLQHARSSLAAK